MSRDFWYGSVSLDEIEARVGRTIAFDAPQRDTPWDADERQYVGRLMGEAGAVLQDIVNLMNRREQLPADRTDRDIDCIYFYKRYLEDLVDVVNRQLQEPQVIRPRA